MPGRLLERALCYAAVTAFLIAALGKIGSLAARGAAVSFAAVVQKNKIKKVEATSDQELWHLDLHKTDPPEFAEGDEKLQLLRDPAEFDSTGFLTDQVLYYTVFTYAPEHGLVRRNQSAVSGALRLKAFFLDAASGKLLRETEWQVEAADASEMGIFPAGNGSYLFFSTSTIVLYSADGVRQKELRMAELATLDSAFDGLFEWPSRKALVLRVLTGKKPACFQINTDDLTHDKITCGDSPAISFAENEVAEATQLSAVDAAAQSLRRTFAPMAGSITVHGADGKTKTICEWGQQTPYCVNPQFLSNEIMAAYGVLDFGLMDVHDHVEFTERFGLSAEYIIPMSRPVRGSPDGNRFVIAINKFEHGIRTSDRVAASVFQQGSGRTPLAVEPDRVSVFDVPGGQWIYTLKNQKEGGWKEILGLALSPNGMRLAVDSEGMVQVYSLPASPPAPDKNQIIIR
jgi:hypothetical protein